MSFPLDHFYRFAQAAQVPSKDRGWTSAWPLYGAQRYGLIETAKGYDEGIRNFLYLSARQVGKTTAFVDLMGLFWPQRHDGITGIMVSDTDENRDYRRDVHGQMLHRLPGKWQYPTRLDNQLVRAWDGIGSRLMYESVGTKFNKSFGRSRGINFLVADEVGAWAHQRAVQALNAALSDAHPHRLYMWNTTAQGHDIFKTMWKEAETSPVTRRIFLGWYLDERLRVPQDNRAIWDQYGSERVTDDERIWMKNVEERYRIELTVEQLVWYRSILDTKFYGDEDMRAQEYPCLPEDAFVSFGSKFFRPALIRQLREGVRRAPEPHGYRYEWGRWLDDTKVEACDPNDEGAITVWEEPDPEGVYIVACHPAYSSSAEAPDDVVQVWRAYPDSLTQVAEYSVAGGDLTVRCAWSCLHLAGSYRQARPFADVYFVMDVEMTGFSVLNEIMRFESRGWGMRQQGRADLRNLMGAVRHYYFRRPDSLARGVRAVEWKSQASFRPWLLNQLRDVLENGHIEIRSPELIDELQSMRRGELSDADVISAGMGGEQSECRVLAAAMAIEHWFTNVQPEIQGRFAPKVKAPRDTNVATMLVGGFIDRVRMTGRGA